MSAIDNPYILVIDDCEDDFILIRRHILKRWPKAHVGHASTITQLTEKLQACPHLVICDYLMPDLTHDQVNALVNRMVPNTPLILLSGMASELAGADAMREGVRDYVDKSRLERLTPVIERELGTALLQEEKAELERAHQRAILFDSSTGFLNRHGLMKTAQALFQKEPSNRSLCLVTISYSRQTRRIAALGPRHWEKLASEMVERLGKLFSRELIGQWTDNLIVAFVEGFEWGKLDQDKAVKVLSDIELELSRPLILDHFPIKPHLRIGLSRVGVDGTDISTLVAHSRSVANVLKSQGQSLCNALEPEIHSQAKRRVMIATGLAQGIESNELQLEFQPVEDLKTGKVIGAEALVRWTHRELGLIMPDEFIGVAENSGLIEALGEWVLNQACHAIKTLRASGHEVWVAINCSSSQLLNPEFCKSLSAALSSFEGPSSLLEIEVTESAAIEDVNGTIEVLDQIRRLGCKIALDDFGTGYSSLSYLRRLPVDVLKIDKSFINDLLEDPSSEQIVKAVVDLAHALDLTVHAEGIESAGQRESLRKLNCDRLQGYLLGKPMSLSVFDRWLKGRT